MGDLREIGMKKVKGERLPTYYVSEARTSSTCPKCRAHMKP